MTAFLDLLYSGRIILMDGAMGTELQRAGLRAGECYEMWNVLHPEVVRGIHQAYVDAGAEVLLTNTFQANPAAHADLDRIFAAAIDNARRASASAAVLADVGPFSSWTADNLQAILRSCQAADAIILETLSGPGDVASFPLRAALDSARPLLLSFTFENRGPAGPLATHQHWSPETCAQAANALDAAALGVNCGRDIGLDEMIAIVRRYRSATSLPLFARPNAGTPRQLEGCWVYPRSPAEMAARVPELLEAGVTMIGGCCGTTPEHIRAFRQVVDEWNR